ncbi:MAG: 16S rRNA (guanine(966)-N(2))-methyltransferase RsmD [Actinomycetota bacterium]|nr:16S rRNA (guanine(966)-N(2))-methyltransferase RsmD [Actinomycetota bacterium]
MRIVAGTARGRRLVAPAGDAVRPTTDRVREALFNSLVSLDAVRDATVLDLFAGSGALGIEALSRGATHATFVDSSPEALRAIRTNLEQTGLADRATVVRADARDHLTRGAATAARVDLALVDPPYSFDEWPSLLAALDAEIVVIESDREVDPGDGATVMRARRYGGTVVTIARYGDPDPGRFTPEDRS